MNEDKDTKLAIKLFQNLSRQRKEILSLPEEKALDRILDSPQPAAIIHSFPEEDFYFLINDIGLEDSLQLLSLASDKQLEYILDIEVWEKDRIGINNVTKWLDLFFRADPQRFVRWFLNKKTEFIEFYLFKNIEVKIREHDQDPSIFGDDFFTLDNVYYIRFVDLPIETESNSNFIKNRNEFLSNFIETLSGYDHNIFQNVLLEAFTVIPAEYEEEAFRLRNVRLAEKGFLPFDEAIGIYQPLKPEALSKQSAKFITERSEIRLYIPVPHYSTGMLKEGNLFTDSLKKIEKDNVLDQIQVELANLANQILVADQKIIRNKEELGDIVKKACGYISIGLKQLAEESNDLDENRAVALIQRFPLSQIFRVGYGLVLELKWRAEKWRKISWFEKNKLHLGFWGEGWIGVLGGLLIKRPLYYDNYKTGMLYREFYSIEDIKHTEKILNEIIGFDNLLSCMTLTPAPPYADLFTYKNMVLTLWARHYLGLSDDLIPIDIDKFKIFFDELWESGKKPRKTSVLMKESFLKWLSEKTGLDTYDISRKVGQTMENLFSEIESEYGSVSKKDLNSKYIHLFIMK
ncbi:MAG: hypothetical protein KJ550_13975 [Proteobacteria bacterium]|nr:hypothetical protein [Pseudomonadota bacterium]MBU4014553.1 hypothetical protein [Pseudomonadota bacterium]MBU4128343.1 hypothetical protein [Pseudomonadota bacterium]